MKWNFVSWFIEFYLLFKHICNVICQSGEQFVEIITFLEKIELKFCFVSSLTWLTVQTFWSCSGSNLIGCLNILIMSSTNQKSYLKDCWCSTHGTQGMQFVTCTLGTLTLIAKPPCNKYRSQVTFSSIISLIFFSFSCKFYDSFYNQTKKVSSYDAFLYMIIDLYHPLSQTREQREDGKCPTVRSVLNRACLRHAAGRNVV